MKFKINVNYNNEKKVLLARENTNLLDLLQENNIEINAYCGGKGKCGKCKIQYLSRFDKYSVVEKDLLSPDEISNNIRLAYISNINQDIKISIPEQENINILEEGNYKNKVFNPIIKNKEIILEKPDLKDQKSFLARLYKILSVSEINYTALKQFAQIDKNKSLTVSYTDRKIIKVEEKKNENNLWGLAIDIGTTTIVIYLLNLLTGKTIDTIAFYNPQKKYGADVISRINYTLENENGIKKLNEELITACNQSITELSKRNNIKKDDILSCTIAGNTVMLHFFMKINAASIASSPYTPVFTEKMELTAAECRFNIYQDAVIYLLPSISGYVGADIVADMLAVNINTEKNQNDLLIDIGTNGEIVLSTDKKIYTCSTAAGPAFEGASITMGTAGIPGAISHFKINNKNQIEYQTINQQPPVGICGSGLLDITAEFLNKGIIDSRGAFASKEKIPAGLSHRLFKHKKHMAFMLVDGQKEIFITQQDIREVQLAKAAVQAGIEILKKEAGVSNKDIDNVYLAGGFGYFLNEVSACRIGLLPDEIKNKVEKIGNGAGIGARLTLLDTKTTEYFEKLKKKVQYIELSANQQFQKEFMEAINFS